MFFYWIILILILIGLGVVLIPNLIDEPRSKKKIWDSPWRVLLLAVGLAVLFWILSNLLSVDSGFRW